MAFFGIFSLGYFYYKNNTKNTGKDQKIKPEQNKEKNTLVQEDKKNIGQKGKVTNVLEIKDKQEGNVASEYKNNFNDWVKI